MKTLDLTPICHLTKAEAESLGFTNGQIILVPDSSGKKTPHRVVVAV